MNSSVVSTPSTPILKKVASTLLDNAGGPLHWCWLSDLRGNKADKATANKFLLGAIMERGMRSEIVWNNAKRLTESPDFLNDPADLWCVIQNTPKKKWDEWWKKGKFHRFTVKMSVCLRQNATLICENYDGDARNIWRNKDRDGILRNLRMLHGVGDAIANMILGGLRDTRQVNIQKCSDVKYDVHVSRVLGRILRGTNAPLSKEKVLRFTQKMHKDPWRLDGPLFQLGRGICQVKPKCQKCYMRGICQYSIKTAQSAATPGRRIR